MCDLTLRSEVVMSRVADGEDHGYGDVAALVERQIVHGMVDYSDIQELTRKDYRGLFRELS